MTKICNYHAVGLRRHRRAAPHCLGLLAGALLLLTPLIVVAQSAELPLPLLYKKFEQAREANDFPAAESYGRSALVATESAPDSQRRDVVDLLLRLGEVSDQAGDDQQALQFYRRALAMQESDLGVDHPDLVPVLTAMAALQLKDKHYAEAEALLQRILKIERTAFGERHQNVLTTLKQLRDTYRAAGDTEALARTERQIEQFGASTRDLGAGKERRYKMNQGYATGRVFYGPDRKTTGSPCVAAFYGSERGDLQYGYLDVTIPETHQEAGTGKRARSGTCTRCSWARPALVTPLRTASIR